MARHIEEMISRQIQRYNRLSAMLRRQSEAGAQGEAVSPDEDVEKPLHPVICLSRDLGSGAREVARELCQRLGYELFGSDLIDQVARDLKVQRRLIDSLDERGRGELNLLLESFLHGREIETGDYLNSLTRVVQTLALQGGVVILGRGASFILGRQSALNVKITAPPAERIARLMRYDQIGEDEARRKIEDSDRNRRRFVRHYFRADLDDPLNYDLTINTTRTCPLAATELILAALRARGHMPERLAIVPAAG
jgi:cytidylate kinase